MLSESQITNVWEHQIGAEVRSLYFGELANRFSTRKQWITGLVFFLSSGAAATLIGKLPSWVPISLSVLTAFLSAYTISVSLDATIRTMSKLHYSWSEIAHGYESLWNDVYSDFASERLDTLMNRERDLSEVATTDAPNDQERMGYWQAQVLKDHHVIGQ